MIDPKLDKITTESSRNLEEVPASELSEKQRAERQKGRRGLSINDTIAGATGLSVGSRGVDTSGVESGSGAASGLTSTTPGEAGESPAPNIVPGARGSGMTPRGDTASGQIPSARMDTARVETEGLTHEQISARAYRCWQERGCPEGSPDVDWCQAEEELQAELKTRRSAAAASGG